VNDMSADPLHQARVARLKTRSVIIATPTIRAPCWQYVNSIIGTCVLLERWGIAYGRCVLASSNLPRVRNELVAQFLASGFTDLMFIDDDMEWRPEDILRFLASEHDVCGGVGRLKIDKEPSDPAAWCGAPAPAPNGLLVQDDMGFIEYEKVGTGIVKITRAAFDRLIAAHPDWKRKGDKRLAPESRDCFYRFFSFPEDALGGEDYAFCEAWRELGGSIWADPNAVIGHIGLRNWSGSLSQLIKPFDASVDKLPTPANAEPLPAFREGAGDIAELMTLFPDGNLR